MIIVPKVPQNPWTAGGRNCGKHICDWLKTGFKCIYKNADAFYPTHSATPTRSAGALHATLKQQYYTPFTLREVGIGMAPLTCNSNVQW